jgi:hypothetical protein
LKLIFLIFLVTALFCNAQTGQNYISFEHTSLNLFKWEGTKVMLLSASDTLDAITMAKWVAVMDSAYNYYTLATGREPARNTNFTYINNRSTLADVPSTCGAGCGYLGTTGIEMLHYYFMNMYRRIRNDNEYDQIPFYEFGRNFWFYNNKLQYQTNDPIVTGYAVFMRFMAMEYAGVNGAPFNETLPFETFKNQVKDLLPAYLNNAQLNWSNTLGVGQGVPGSPWGATDLFASFCFYLKENYGGHEWVRNVWKFAGLRPNITSTQDAVDNFIIASSQAANVNLTSLFQSWRWPVSMAAINELMGMFSPLPVSLISFKASVSACTSIRLNWITASEANNKGFDVEYSTDGNQFTKIVFVEAKPNSGNGNTYDYFFNSGGNSHNYFRLKQLDINGQFSYSSIVSVKNNCNGNLVTIFPNPVKNTFSVNGLANYPHNIKLFNGNGIILSNWTNSTQTNFDISGFRKGMYILNVDGKNYKLIKD